ncbi:MAG: aquaporin NIP [Urechidicola sp.]
MKLAHQVQVVVKLMSNLLKHTVAEMMGTFIMVFFGTGAMIINELHGNVITHLGVAIAWGLVVLAMIYSIGNKSGAHMNPAVTLSFLLDKRISFKKSGYYIIAQIFGAILASFVLKFMFPEAIKLGETVPVNSWQQAFVMEFILSFFLMFVIFNVATGAKEEGVIAGLVIGITVLICALVGGPISVASMNPARTIGPAIASGNYTHMWLYMIAPISGMFVSYGAWKIIK